MGVSAQITLGTKSPKVTPHSDHTRVGSNQPCTYPSSTIPKETLCPLAPSDSSASGSHGAAKCAQDANLAKIAHLDGDG